MRRPRNSTKVESLVLSAQVFELGSKAWKASILAIRLPAHEFKDKDPVYKVYYCLSFNTKNNIIPNAIVRLTAISVI